MAGHLVLCTGAGTQEVNADVLSAAIGQTCGRVHETLCPADSATAARAFAHPGTLMACGHRKLRA